VSEIPLLMNEPPGAASRLTIALAHGAGAAMDSPFMEEVALALAAESFRVARFEFPYMEELRRTGERGRPDLPSVLESTWLTVIQQLGPPSALVIGGKSMGGRIASMVADKAGVKGLVCLGYPFHPTGSPGTLRVAHLESLKTPALFLQGERDTLGNREEISGYRLSPSIRIVFLPDGDHSFKPRKASGRSYPENMTQAIKEIVSFCAAL
jgi:predicted alpha/beta-hydrolase family hydrolase